MFSIVKERGCSQEGGRGLEEEVNVEVVEEVGLEEEVQEDGLEEEVLEVEDRLKDVFEPTPQLSECTCPAGRCG